MDQRDFVIAGNWKMHKTVEESKVFMHDFKPYLKNNRCKIILFVPYTNIESCVKLSAKTDICVGAQNFHWEDSGAFTGEISIKMLSGLGVKNYLVGHSERRRCFGETDDVINRKIKKAVSEDVSIVLCVGETHQQRESGAAIESVISQVKEGLSGINNINTSKIYIAYEPVWAIGTGRVANPQEVNQMCGCIRTCISDGWGAGTGEKFKILYGGSVDRKTCREFLLMSDINGVLVGGASLDPDEFGGIIGVANDILNEGND